MIILYQATENNPFFDRLHESIIDAGLSHLASDLFPYCFATPDEMNVAVERAIMACHTSGQSVRANFKLVYICKEEQVSCDWRISALGRRLIILNANPVNPLVAKMQLELVNHED